MKQQRKVPAAPPASGFWTDAAIARARRDTPATASLIHFNNAGASLMPEPVNEVVAAHLTREREIGPYEAAAEAAAALAAVHPTLASLIGAQASEIAIMDSASRAWIAAFGALRFQSGDCILTTTSEYASNFIPYLQAVRRYGVRIEVVPDGDDGALSLTALERMIGPDVRLISVNHIPTHDGLVNPAAAIGRLARAAGIPFLLDACQSVGQMPVDVAEIGCDMLTATGRKFLRGPRGTGFLYIRQAFADTLEPWMLDLHGADWTSPERYEPKPGAQRFELWEFDHAARLGLAAAARYAASWGLSNIKTRIQTLATHLRSRLAVMPGVVVRDRGAVKSGIVTFTVADEDPFALQLRLRAERINVSVSKARSARVDFARLDDQARLRASVHYYNTTDEIDRMTARLERLIAGRAA